MEIHRLGYTILLSHAGSALKTSCSDDKLSRSELLEQVSLDDKSLYFIENSKGNVSFIFFVYFVCQNFPKLFKIDKFGHK